MKLATIYYTAYLFTPDDSDTNVYGEPCEPGYGENVQSGWWSPDFSYWEVNESRNQAEPDIVVSDGLLDEREYKELIEEVIESRIGAIDSFDGDTAYASDPRINYITGVHLMCAAHVIREERNVQEITD